MAHDQRTGAEPWAWLVSVSEEEFDRDSRHARLGLAMSLAAQSLPALQRVGDAVVYCGASTGVLVGIGEVADEPLPRADGPVAWRLRVVPKVVLERAGAPSLHDAGMRPPRLARRLEPAQYERLHEMITGATRPDAAAPQR